MSFAYLLVLFALTIFGAIILVILLIRSSKRFTEFKAQPRASWLFKAYVIATGIFFLSSIYYILVGQRDYIWFFVFTMLGLLSLYFVGSSNSTHRKISILTVFALALLQSILPILQNRGVIFGPDQWRDLRVTEFIIDNGTFNNFPEFETGFYSFIPLFNVLNAAFSGIVGCPTMTTFAVLQGVLSLISALCVYVIMKLLTRNVTFSVLAVLLFVSIPRLAIVQAVPSRISISLGLLLMLLFLKGGLKLIALRSIVTLTALFAIVIAMLHPVGVFPILGISLGVVLMSFVFTRERLPERIISFTKTVFSICFFITLVYWTLDSRVFASVFNPLIRFLNILTRFEYVPSVYTPQYIEGGFELSSFAWALPMSLSAACLVMFLISAQKGKPRLSRDLREHFIVISALIGGFLIVMTFVSLILAPGAAVERYVNIVGYSLLIVPSSFMLGYLFLSHKMFVVLFAALLFSAGLFLGSSSPDWAPFENPGFGATRFTYVSSVEADTLVDILPNNTRLYEDHDIFISNYAQLRNVLFITDKSYQTTRGVIQDFKNNSFESFEPKYKGAIIVIKTDEIIDQELFNKYVNIQYNSERHIVVSSP